MKFGIAKLPKTFLQRYQKKFKRKKNNNKELSSTKDRKVNTNLCYDGKKSFDLGKFSPVASEDLAPPFPFNKNTFFETSCNDKKTNNEAIRKSYIQSYLND